MNQHIQKTTLSEYVVCPQTFTKLVLCPSGVINTDPATRLCYPVIDELPVLIPDRAVQLDLATWQQLIEQHAKELHS